MCSDEALKNRNFYESILREHSMVGPENMLNFKRPRLLEKHTNFKEVSK